MVAACRRLLLAAAMLLPYPAFAEEVAGQGIGISLPTALFFAWLGGLILNAMPCVFPVLSLKALALAKKAHVERREAMAQALAYTAGVVLSFLILAAALLALREGGEAVGWGYHMQSSRFVFVMSAVMLLVGLSLSGVMEVPAWFSGTGQGLTEGRGLQASFFTGVLATLVATPCTAPFMAPALGFALTQPVPVILVIFTFLGLGLASPYLLIGLHPPLLRFLPKPGAWMDGFKQLLAFPMYGGAAWLLWVLAQQTSSIGHALALFSLVTLAMACHLWRVMSHKPVARMLVLAIFLLPSVWAWWHMEDAVKKAPLAAPSETLQEMAYTPAALDQLRKEGRGVLLDATAAWCITCKINERTSIRTEETTQLLQQHQIVLMIADWTGRDPDITDLLSHFGRSGVPMVVLYPPSGDPVLLPEVLTQAIVTEAIQKQF